MKTLTTKTKALRTQIQIAHFYEKQKLANNTTVQRSKEKSAHNDFSADQLEDSELRYSDNSEILTKLIRIDYTEL
jgi:hypothetical protein